MGKLAHFTTNTKANINRGGYQTVTLCKDQYYKQKRLKVHYSYYRKLEVLG